MMAAVHAAAACVCSRAKHVISTQQCSEQHISLASSRQGAASVSTHDGVRVAVQMPSLVRVCHWQVPISCVRVLYSSQALLCMPVLHSMCCVHASGSTHLQPCLHLHPCSMLVVFIVLHWFGFFLVGDGCYCVILVHWLANNSYQVGTGAGGGLQLKFSA
jgi:hypothetical protein